MEDKKPMKMRKKIKKDDVSEFQINSLSKYDIIFISFFPYEPRKLHENIHYPRGTIEEENFIPKLRRVTGSERYALYLGNGIIVPTTTKDTDVPDYEGEETDSDFLRIKNPGSIHELGLPGKNTDYIDFTKAINLYELANRLNNYDYSWYIRKVGHLTQPYIKEIQEKGYEKAIDWSTFINTDVSPVRTKKKQDSLKTYVITREE